MIDALRRMQGSLVRLFYPYGSVRTIFRGPARGLEYVVEPGMGLTYALAPRIMHLDFLANLVQPGMTVYDVGANKGQMTLFFAACVGPKGRVHSFEPVPEEFESLQRNVQLNRLPNVCLWQVALAERDGTARFRYLASRPSSGRLWRDVSGYANLDPGTERVVATRSLDSIVREGAPLPDIIKIDVEGAADLVLRGARSILDRVSPSVYLELHGGVEQAGIRDELVTRGYRVETIQGTLVGDVTSSWNNPLWCYQPAPPRRSSAGTRNERLSGPEDAPERPPVYAPSGRAESGSPK